MIRNPRVAFATAILAALSLVPFRGSSSTVTPAANDAAVPAADFPAALDTAATGVAAHAPRVPAAFVPNLGQWAHDARFIARFGEATIGIDERGWTMALRAIDGAKRRAAAVRMAVVGATACELVGEQRAPGHHSYFLGDDRTRWRAGVPVYGAVRGRGVLPGIDLRWREHDGHFEYDVLVAPGADLAAVEIAVDGVDGLALDAEGALVMSTPLGPVRMTAPLSWEEGPDGAQVPIRSCYELRGTDRFGFAAPGRRPDRALVVDPGLVWSTFLGGLAGDSARSVTLDAQGAVWVAGNTRSLAFPATPGAFDPTYNGGLFGDVFVARLSEDGSTLLHATYLGGTGDELPNQMVVDTAGAATIVGYTGSPDFPTTPAALRPNYVGGSSDAFVVQLAPGGASLTYSTYLGGTARDAATGLAFDAQGQVVVVGHTASADFPTSAGAFDTTYNGTLAGDTIGDGFVACLAANGASLVFATYFGGSGSDSAGEVHVDAGGVTFAGSTGSANLPTTPGAFDTTYGGGSNDAFCARLSANGSVLLFSTLLGGNGNDYASGLAVDAQGLLTLCGGTSSPGFPTTPGAYDPSYSGAALGDTFVTRLDPTASGLVFSTFLGGSDFDYVWGLAVDARGAAIVVGDTSSPDFPTTPGALDRTFGAGVRDGFVARFSPMGDRLEYSTFLGSSNDDGAYAVVLDARSRPTVVGITSSSTFPTTPGAYDTSFNSLLDTDAFVTRLDLLPTGAVAHGISSPGCSGELAIGVTSMPSVGNAAFGLTCDDAAPTTPGLIAFSTATLAVPLPVLGIDVWIDPSSLLSTSSLTSDSIGGAFALLPIPAAPPLVGVTLAAQFVWIGPSSPPPCPASGFSASNALALTIQP